ncbi:50S ribosomal protein L11 methyltransferase [Helicobacter aurati]|nr:50S ribosomal protein L11 methyltransferase [Helicobacter aurati]
MKEKINILHPLAHKLSGEKLDNNPIRITESNIVWRSNKSLSEIEQIINEIRDSCSEVFKALDKQSMVESTIEFIPKKYNHTFYTTRLHIPNRVKNISNVDFKIALRLLIKHNNPFMNKNYRKKTIAKVSNLIIKAKTTKPITHSIKDMKFYTVSQIEAVRIHLFKVQNKDWIEEYKKSIQPIVCGKFYISPSWHKDKKPSKHSAQVANTTQEIKSNVQHTQSDELHTIILEPSLSFGSGHHASTKMCIMFLSQLDLKGKSLLDVGCGSGILSLVGAKLGAQIYACDTDYYACTQTKQNFHNNNVKYQMIWQGSLESIVHTNSNVACITTLDNNQNTAIQDLTIAQHAITDSTISESISIKPPLEYDYICANIVSSVIILLRRNLIACLKKGGILILSGILEDHEKRIMKEFDTLQLLEKQQIEEWIALKFIKK